VPKSKLSAWTTSHVGAKPILFIEESNDCGFLELHSATKMNTVVVEKVKKQ